MGLRTTWKNRCKEQKLLKEMRQLSPGSVIYNCETRIMVLNLSESRVQVSAYPVNDLTNPFKQAPSDVNYSLAIAGTSLMNDKQVFQAIRRACWSDVAIPANTFDNQPNPLTFAEVEIVFLPPLPFDTF